LPTPTATLVAPTATPVPPTVTPTPVPSGNLVANPGFEIDTNNDNRPDVWSTHTNATRSNERVYSGNYALRNYATNNSSYTLSQTIASVTPGATYTAAGWINIPATTDSFTFRLQIRWRNASNGTIRTDTVKTYTTSTQGWNEARATLVAPANATNAQVLLVVSSLNATVYVDEVFFSR
jgi:hypothetical protein